MYNCMQRLNKSPILKIYYVDAPADPSVGMFIVGTVGTDTIYASALLTQT